MTYLIEYGNSFDPKSMRPISHADQDRIAQAIKTKLTKNPEIFGKPLRGGMKGIRRLRVGDYRVLFVIRKSTIIILDIGHRSTIYTNNQEP